jgi:hypothetical protein
MNQGRLLDFHSRQAWQALRTVSPWSHDTHESVTPFSTHRLHGRSSSHLQHLESRENAAPTLLESHENAASTLKETGEKIFHF